MLTNEFLESFADFYGDFSLDEIAERMGVSSAELIAYSETLLEDNYDTFVEEMGFSIERDGEYGED